MLLFSVMASAIKGIVSKNKIRYKEDGFDLDLSYISKNIIAMGFPAETLERFYRNHIDDVVKFFDAKHRNRYKIYNLCSESKRRYDHSKFHGSVDVEYSFQDHNPPPFAILKPFCESVHEWLSGHSQNVAGIHCKAGKGRTGVMICAYLVHAGGCEVESGEYVEIGDANAALEYYGRHRTHDSKGVTIPSQKRYVYYYEDLVKRNLKYRVVPLKLSAVTLTSIPVYNGGSYTLICEVYEIPKKKLKTFNIEVKKGSKSVTHKLDEELCVMGDIKFEFYVKKIKKEKIFQFCLNTFFVEYGTDAFTLATESCFKCSGDAVSLISSKSMSTLSKDSLINGSVIDVSLLNLVNSSRSENIHYCDCNNSFISSSYPPEFFLRSNPTAPHSSNDTGIHNPSSSLPSTSSLSNDTKLSISSSSTSSSSSIQSLNRKIVNSDLQLNKPAKRDLVCILSKDKLDKAYKDKSNKIFSSDFKVALKFTTLESELSRQPSPKLVNQCFLYNDNSSSENDSENFSEEEDASDLETTGNIAERKSICTFSTSTASFNNNSKKGETTHL